MPDIAENFEIICADVLIKIKGKGLAWESGSEATVKVKINENVEHSVADGNGPLNALDNALHKALCSFSCLEKVRLPDYAVNVVNGISSTTAFVKVFIWFSNGEKHWTVEKTSTDIISASFQALVEGYKIAISSSEKV